MRIVITGGNGQLGTALCELSSEYPQSEFVFVGREELPLEDVAGIPGRLTDLSPDVIIHAGAYTAVDRAEDESALADLINHQATAVISNWCLKANVRLIYISTDYVFGGDENSARSEIDTTHPINAYGLSKWKGEQAVLASGAEAIIIRTSWMYHDSGHNFVRTMMRLMEEREVVKVVNDQQGSPTYAGDLAHAILYITHDQVNWRSGVYHYSNEGSTTWHGFATAIRDLGGYNSRVEPISTEQFPTAARRPSYSLLDKSKIKTTFGLAVPHWRDSLAIVLDRIKNS